MSLRRESIRAYRELFRAAARSSRECALYNETGLSQYISARFAQEAETHSRQLANALHALEQRAGATKSPKHRAAAVNRARTKLLGQYQKHVSQEIDKSRALAQALYLAPENRQVVSVLQVLSAGVGNRAYQQVMESSILAFLEHNEKRTSRDEVADDATSDRQNRIMLQALLPYAERLLLVHRTAIGEQNRESALAYLTPWQVTEAIVGSRSGVSAVHLRVGREHIVVEIDETYNKQVIYVCCTRQDGSDSGSYEWAQDVERVEISESEEVQRTVFYNQFLLMATRICDALLHDSPVHPTRSTVVIGHAVGGAVGLILSLLLSQRGFGIANTISLGAPKSLQGTLERYVAAINPVRVVLAGDPLIELPVTGAEGAPFVHIGEILLLSPSQSAPTEAPPEHLTAPPVASASASEVSGSFTAEALNDLMNDGATPHKSFSDASDGPKSSSYTSDAKEETAYTQSDGDDSTEVLARAARRYREKFLVEHYLEQMQDQTVELTYAEGDEVWDEGDYEEMKRAGAREPSVTAEERRVRDLRGPL